MTLKKEFTFDRVVRIAITVAVVYVLYLFINRIRGVLIPFAIAALLAYILNPLILFIQKRLRVKNRIVSILLGLLFVLAAGGIATAVFVPLISNDIKDMGRVIKNVANDPKLEALQYLPDTVANYAREIVQREEVQKFFNSDKFGDTVMEAVKKIVPGVWGVFGKALDLVLGIVGLAIILLYLVFILLDYEEIMSGWKELIPPMYREGVIEVAHNFTDAMSKYFRAQGMIASIMGILFAIAFSIIGLPMAIVFGLLVGLLNMIPYMQNIAFIPAAFLALIQSLDTGQSFWMIFGFVVLTFALIQLLQDGFLTPKIMGDATGLNPAVMLLSLSIWGSLLGVLGLIIALPMTFLIWSYYKRFLRLLTKEESKVIASGIILDED